jgi:hypothetical protein
MNHDSYLLGDGILNRELLRKLSQHRHDVLRGNVRTRVAAERILERIVTNMTLCPRALQVRVRRERGPGVLTEQTIAVVCAGAVVCTRLPEQQTGKLRHQALWGIL